MAFGRKNVSIGLFAMVFFMAYGFLLVFLRDFAPGKGDWIAGYAVHPHFDARLGHMHGNLFALLCVLSGYLIAKLPIDDSLAPWSSWLALAGMLMPLGILGEVYLATPPWPVLVGGASMLLSAVVLATATLRRDHLAG